jgi:uncharacterized protein YerC
MAAKRIPKLTFSQSRADVLSIRRMCRRGSVYQKTIAKQFGVSEATISYVVNGGRWGKLTGGRRF